MKINYKIINLVLTLLILGSIILPENVYAAATFSLSPSTKSLSVGSTVSAKLIVNTGGKSINAVEGTVSFASDVLEYQSVSTAGSIISFWTSGPTGSSTSVHFSGGLPNPGYNGSNGTILTITWKAKAQGVANISITGTKILENDGVGTNIYGGSNGDFITVTAPRTSQVVSVVSPSHPDQNTWYVQKELSLSWSALNSLGYSFDLNQSGNSDPSGAVVNTTSKNYSITSDGVWYFHIKAKFDSGWGPITHFKIQIDGSPPADFAVTVNQTDRKDPYPVVTFEASDPVSGIARYEASIDGGDYFAIKSGDKLPKQRPGSHTVVVRVFDNAGNSTLSKATSFTIEGISPPRIIRWDKMVGLLEPINIVGLSDADDTILIFYDNKEIARFKASEFKTGDSGSQIVWDYPLKNNYTAGTYGFQVGRIDKNEAESSLTNELGVKVVISYIKLGVFNIPTIYVLLFLLAIVFLLLLLVIYLLKKLRDSIRNKTGIGIAIYRVRHMFSKTEKDIDQDIDRLLPDTKTADFDIKEIKKELKAEIHEEIKEEEESLNDSDAVSEK